MNDIEKKEPDLSIRFTNMVIKKYGTDVGEVKFSGFQKRLAQNYFVSIDIMLKKAESKRNNKYNKLPYVWGNVDLEEVARLVVANSRIGLDPAIKNHIHFIPYKNKVKNKYDVNFMTGYTGIELKAMKYGLDVPDKVLSEVVYKNDNFVPKKKSINNTV